MRKERLLSEWLWDRQRNRIHTDLSEQIGNQCQLFWLLFCMQNCSSPHLCFSGYQRPWNRCDLFPSTTIHTVPSYEITCHSIAEFLQCSKQCYPHFSATSAPLMEITPVIEKFLDGISFKKRVLCFHIWRKKSVAFLMNNLGCFTLS